MCHVLVSSIFILFFFLVSIFFFFLYLFFFFFFFLSLYFVFFFFFFFQAEDGIRDGTVTGVQTCALPISALPEEKLRRADVVNSFFRYSVEDEIGAARRAFGVRFYFPLVRPNLGQRIVGDEDDHEVMSFSQMAIRAIRKSHPAPLALLTSRDRRDEVVAGEGYVDHAFELEFFPAVRVFQLLDRAHDRILETGALCQAHRFKRIQALTLLEIDLLHDFLVCILAEIPGPLLHRRQLRRLSAGRRRLFLKALSDFAKVVLKRTVTPESRQRMIPEEKDHRIDIDIFETSSQQQREINTSSTPALDDFSRRAQTLSTQIISGRRIDVTELVVVNQCRPDRAHLFVDTRDRFIIIGIDALITVETGVAVIPQRHHIILRRINNPADSRIAKQHKRRQPYSLDIVAAPFIKRRQGHPVRLAVQQLVFP